MKYRFFTSLLLLSATAFSTFALIKPSPAQPSQQGVRYTCTNWNYQGEMVPTTMADTPRGRIAMIVWKSDFFSGSGWTPERRCQSITRRFQAFHNALSYYNKDFILGLGTVNRQPVICAMKGKQEGQKECYQNGALITLEPSDNALAVFKGLVKVASYADSGPLVRGTNDVINVDEWLSNASPIDD
ncbi:hypothetical protein PCC7418_3450 [Halothece sp. PCC 7418]|uniref:COP23 domain-containing protein n=1 Tax=Halothece sp. (strain PCC 7418) TaxID=65093 RepID=UPI0002A075A6|nr:COP23 domain-containing protein [Halothece sp. PCC 7418]AFZ45564.1 hypothetical protein PCC7418_3450 [Halothece sp. PCC 7418]